VAVKKIRHTGIVVSNLEDSLSFYRDLLGFSKVSLNEESGLYIDTMLGMEKTAVVTVKMECTDGQQIELLDYRANMQRDRKHLINEIGISHIAFEVEDLHSLFAKLSEAGTPFISSPVTTPDGYAMVAFCIAPEGTHVELVEIL
jgi:catechol 2,3-dioxygenase-like lactoylglutathione lyase family enzyme